MANKPNVASAVAIVVQQLVSRKVLFQQTAALVPQGSAREYLKGQMDSVDWCIQSIQTELNKTVEDKVND